ncbi:MAG: DNA adenine methylase [Candidatus Dormibacteria bacterium]
MGSKYSVMASLVDVLASLDFDTVLDAFSGSGVVAYALKALGKAVTANDFLTFSATIARATIENSSEQLDSADVARILGPNADGRDFISRTFRGLYFDADDLAFLDSAWSQIDQMTGSRRDLALASLCLAAAWKQPRGVFTVTSFRYDDGRRQLRTPLSSLFVEAVKDYNSAIFDSGHEHHTLCQDIALIPPVGFDVVYLDPPYAPPHDDCDYIKRYHFLEGLSVYWQDRRIRYDTMTRKLEKRFTPFAYPRTIREALRSTFDQFRDSTIVFSYSSNAVPDATELMSLLKSAKKHVQMIEVPHRYSFGTHAAAQRRQVSEYIFVGE